MLMKSSVYVRWDQYEDRQDYKKYTFLTRTSKASIQLLKITRSPKICVSDKIEKRKKASETDDASEGTVINKVDHNTHNIF